MVRSRLAGPLILAVTCLIVGAALGVVFAVRANTAGGGPPSLLSAAGVRSPVQISDGVSSACALAGAGRVDCWGLNAAGLLGVGVSEATGCEGYCTPAPQPVPEVTDAVSVGDGDEFACALLGTGGIDCWGANNFGQLGTGSVVGPQTCNVLAGSLPCSPQPVAVSGVRDAISLGVGSDNACAVVRGGSVYCWGAAVDGVLGDGSTTGSQLCGSGAAAIRCSPAAVPVYRLGRATTISLGAATACALLSSGQVMCWGDNASAELGDGSTTGPQTCDGTGGPGPCSDTPVLVKGLSHATALSVGSAEACAVVHGGHVACWGNNADGELGIGSATAPDSCGAQQSACADAPMITVLKQPARSVSAGAQDACALMRSGSVTCWGSTEGGQLGVGNRASISDCVGSAQTGDEACVLHPTAVAGLSAISAVSAGQGSACAMSVDEAVECWGDNRAGQLGIGGNGGPEQCASASGPLACATKPRRVIDFS